MSVAAVLSLQLKCSPTVSCHHRLSAGSIATCRRQSGASTSAASISSRKTLPSCLSRSAIARNMSVLPEPDAPLSATHSAGSSVRSTGP